MSNASTPYIMFHITIAHQITHTEAVDSLRGVSCRILNWCLKLRYFHLSRLDKTLIEVREENIQQSAMFVNKGERGVN